MIYWILIILAILTWLHFYYKRKFSYWSDQGLKGPRPLWVIGNIHQRLGANLHTLEHENFKKYGTVYGEYTATYPVLVLGDPELVKQVLIKDFHLFVNRPEIQAYHEAWNQNLFSTNGENWKRLRTITSPSFSSGKLRAMSGLMRKCIDKLDGHFNKLSNSPSNSGVMEVKQTMAGFTVDVIASTAFATETHANSDTENPFVTQGRALFDFNPLRAASTFLLPGWLLKILGIEHFFPPKPFEFFLNLARHIVEQRNQQLKQEGGTCLATTRNDLLQLMMDASVDEKELTNINYDKMTADDDKDETRKVESEKNEKSNSASSTKGKLTDSEIIANMIFFFIAGYETTASTLSHCIYELAMNPDIQERLHQEVSQALEKFDGNDDGENSDEYFDTVMSGIPYLEAVMKETLRRYPPVSQMNRMCAQDGYKLGPVTVNKGTIILLSNAGIHLNPEYYPEPRKFNPDRFLPENKHLLVPYTYLPFSLGPRNCVAMRFAYQEIRLCLVRIVNKYRFERTPETPPELKIKKGSGLIVADPFTVKVCRR